MDISVLKSLKLQVSIDCMPGEICHGKRTDMLHLTLINTNRNHALNAQQAQTLSEWLASHGYHSVVNYDEVTLKLHTKDRAIDLVHELDHARIFDSWTGNDSRSGRVSNPCSDVQKLVKKIEHGFNDYHRDQTRNRSGGQNTGSSEGRF